MKMKKISTLLLASLMATSVMSGCGGSTVTTPASSSTPSAGTVPTSSGDTAAPAPSGESVTIKVATWDLSTGQNAAQLLSDAFTTENPNIKIDLIDMPSADYTQKMSVMLNGGSDLDAFWVKDADTTFGMQKKGQLADLTPYIEKDAIDVAAYSGLVENFKFDGKVVGIPTRTDYYVLYYNKDLFDAAGVPYPSNDITWKEFEETAKKLTSGEGATKNYGALIHTWQACVQNWAVADGKNTIMAEDYSFFKPSYEMALRMQNEDKSILDFATMKTANIHYSSPFLTGNVAMMPMGTWFMTTLKDKIQAGESNVNWGVATIPHWEHMQAGETVGATTIMAINAASKKQDAAWEFIKFASSAKGAEITSKAGMIPAISSEDAIANIAAIDGLPDGVKEALAVKMITLDRPIADKVSEVNEMMKEEHGMIMLGESSLDDGLLIMADRSKEIQGK